MERLVYKFPAFEGPLDVLLFLISKSRLNIYDIPISDLLSQYLKYLGEMREMDLDIASEFLDMASKLVQVKSAMLLPKHEDDDENDPRRELVKALIEYKTCKDMAEALRCRNEGFNCFVREPVEIGHDETYKVRHENIELFNAYMAVSRRIRRRMPPPVTAFSGIVDRKVVTVASRIVHVIKRLMREGAKQLRDLFDDAAGRSEVVATFLAVLDLVKTRQIAINGDDGFETVTIVRSVRQKWR
jgi:segregation and condensation protein A